MRKIAPPATPRLAMIKPSLIRKYLALASELELSGKEIFHFEIGRPDFDTPEPIKEAAIKALRAGLVHYTMTRGIPELREAIAADVEARLKIPVDPHQQVTVTAGSSNAVSLALHLLLRPGDEILAPEPMYLFYLDWGQLLGAKTVGVPLDPANGFQLTEEALKSKITDRTRIIALNSPHNPTGTGLNRESLEAVAKIAQEHDLVVLSDEVYDRIIYPPFEHLSPAQLSGMAERTLIFNSFSKSFAMDGWRLGYIIAPEALTDEMENIQHRDVMSNNTFCQYGGIEALRLGDELIEPMRQEYEIRRDLIMEMIDRTEALSCGTPQGGFYAWLKMTDPALDDLEVAEHLLREVGVSLTPGTVFGGEGRGYLRLSWATDRESIEKGTRLLIRTVEEMSG